MITVLYSNITSRLVFLQIFDSDSVHRIKHTVKGWTVWIAIVFVGYVISWVIGSGIPFFNELLSLMSSLFDWCKSAAFPTIIAICLCRFLLFRVRLRLRRSSFLPDLQGWASLGQSNAKSRIDSQHRHCHCWPLHPGRWLLFVHLSYYRRLRQRSCCWRFQLVSFLTLLDCFRSLMLPIISENNGFTGE